MLKMGREINVWVSRLVISPYVSPSVKKFIVKNQWKRFLIVKIIWKLLFRNDQLDNWFIFHRVTSFDCSLKRTLNIQWMLWPFPLTNALTTQTSLCHGDKNAYVCTFLHEWQMAASWTAKHVSSLKRRSNVRQQWKGIWEKEILILECSIYCILLQQILKYFFIY